MNYYLYGDGYTLEVLSIIQLQMYENEITEKNGVSNPEIFNSRLFQHPSNGEWALEISEDNICHTSITYLDCMPSENFGDVVAYEDAVEAGWFDYGEEK